MFSGSFCNKASSFTQIHSASILSASLIKVISNRCSCILIKTDRHQKSPLSPSKKMVCVCECVHFKHNMLSRQLMRKDKQWLIFKSSPLPTIYEISLLHFTCLKPFRLALRNELVQVKVCMQVSISVKWCFFSCLTNFFTCQSLCMDEWHLWWRSQILSGDESSELGWLNEGIKMQAFHM